MTTQQPWPHQTPWVCTRHCFRVITDHSAGTEGTRASWNVVPCSLRAYIWPREQGQGQKLKANWKSLSRWWQSQRYKTSKPQTCCCICHEAIHALKLQIHSSTWLEQRLANSKCDTVMIHCQEWITQISSFYSYDILSTQSKHFQSGYITNWWCCIFLSFFLIWRGQKQNYGPTCLCVG